MNIDVLEKNDVKVILVNSSSLDASNIADFKSLVIPELEGEEQVVLDLGKLEFVDSSGLGAFLSCMRKVTGSGGVFKLAALNSTVRSLFELVRMHRVIEIYNTVDEAMASFK
ncbi:MAG: STAS domain-containing protein [Kiritimatiellae bacterium]|jgi:anti-sigma B factor antagonist|nr:STAS domain-containing protein [Kiritimatiellia bacterium]